MAGEHGDQPGPGNGEEGVRKVTNPLFEHDLRDTGVRKGTGPSAQAAAEQQTGEVDAFALSRLVPRPDVTIAIPRVPFSEEGDGINPAEILPPHVLEEFSKPDRGDVSDPEHGLQYLSATWQTAHSLASDLSLDANSVFDTWLHESATHGQGDYYDQTHYRVGNFSDYLQRRVDESIDRSLQDIDVNEQAQAKQEYLWRRRAAFAPLFSVPLRSTSGSIFTETKDRKNLARILSGDKEAIVTHLSTSLQSNYSGVQYADGEELLLGGFVSDEELRGEHALAAYAGAITRPWNSRAEGAERAKSGYRGGKVLVLEDEIFDAFVTTAESHADSLEHNEMWTDPQSAERQRVTAVEPDHLLLTPFPDKVTAYLNGDVPEGSFPRSEIQQYLHSLEPLIGLSPSVQQQVTRRIHDAEILQLEAAEAQHEDQGDAFLQALVSKLPDIEQEETPTKPVHVKMDMHAGYTKIDVTDTSDGKEKKLHFHVVHGEEPTINWEGSGFQRYTDIRDYLTQLNSQDASAQYDIDQEYLLGLYSGGLRGQAENLQEAFGGTDISFADVRDRVDAGGYTLMESRSLGEDIPRILQNVSSQIRNPALLFYWRIADRLHASGDLSSPETSIPLMVADTQVEELSIPANDPYSTLKSLTDADPVIAAAQLRAIQQDISFPELTLRKGEYGSELMSQEGVYDALDTLREQGFTAVLGKKMAEEFSGQAAGVYIQHALPALGYEVTTAPMEKLLEWQRELVQSAGEYGYTGNAGEFVAGGYAMTAGKEQEVIDFLQSQQGEVQVNGWDLSQYDQARQVFERFFDFADESGLSGYKRYTEMPQISWGDSSALRVASSYGISDAATEHFAAKAVDWSLFLSSLSEDAGTLPHFGEAYQNIRTLGNQLSGELTDMSQGDITTRAKQIIHGEVTAVGEDIHDPIRVQTFADFYKAVGNLLKTPKINLILLKDGSFGWEISTREKSSATRRSLF